MHSSDTYYSLIFKEFQAALGEAARQKSNAIANGSLESFSEYKEACGHIQGLEMSLTVFETVIDKLKEENNEL